MSPYDVFDKAFEKVMWEEGGYTNHPDDPGGATKYGVSLRWLKSIFGDLNEDGVVDEHDVLVVDKMVAKRLFYEHFWKPNRCGEIAYEELAIKLFDLSVLMGVHTAAKLLQKAYNVLTPDPEWQLKVDGLVGPKTLHAVNTYRHPLALLGALKGEGYERLKMIANPSFMAGWVKRVVIR